MWKKYVWNSGFYLFFLLHNFSNSLNSCQTLTFTVTFLWFLYSYSFLFYQSFPLMDYFFRFIFLWSKVLLSWRVSGAHSELLHFRKCLNVSFTPKWQFIYLFVYLFVGLFIIWNNFPILPRSALISQVQVTLLPQPPWLLGFQDPRSKQ